ncbi:MAG: GTPase Era, partial [Acidobacteria bacterium]|nr:GTPase Era [Acidobacteriota bacterium]
FIIHHSSFIIPNKTVTAAPRSGYTCIAGRPNSGKSTLLNRLVGQKISIVSSRPQTTRNRILGILTEARGQVVFVDTPGIHRPYYQMNRRMARLIEQSLYQADLLLHMVDASVAFGSGEKKAMEMMAASGRITFLVLNKVDLIDKRLLLPQIDFYRQHGQYVEFVPISALTGENIDTLLAEIFRYLPAREPMFPTDQVTDRPERFIVSELIRERVSEATRQEVPHAAAVVIDRFDESDREHNWVRIAATIVVEKQAHKKIIIGRGGGGIKAIGSAARLNIERLLACRVYLELFVKVVEKWRDQDRFLDRIGIER